MVQRYSLDKKKKKEGKKQVWLRLLSTVTLAAT